MVCDRPENEKRRIFVFALSNQLGVSGLLGIAIAEDGQVLAAQEAADREWFRFHLGLTSCLSHNAYRSHCSGGYELIEVAEDEIREHQGLAAAFRRNRELGQPTRAGDIGLGDDPHEQRRISSK